MSNFNELDPAIKGTIVNFLDTRIQDLSNDISRHALSRPNISDDIKDIHAKVSEASIALGRLQEAIHLRSQFQEPKS